MIKDVAIIDEYSTKTLEREIVSLLSVGYVLQGQVIPYRTEYGATNYLATMVQPEVENPMLSAEVLHSNEKWPDPDSRTAQAIAELKEILNDK